MKLFLASVIGGLVVVGIVIAIAYVGDALMYGGF